MITAALPAGKRSILDIAGRALLTSPPYAFHVRLCSATGSLDIRPPAGQAYEGTVTREWKGSGVMERFEKCFDPRAQVRRSFFLRWVPFVPRILVLLSAVSFTPASAARAVLPARGTRPTSITVQNGSFEDGLINWECIYSKKTYRKTPVEVSSERRWEGGKSVLIRSAGRVSRIELAQRLETPPAGRFEATVMYRPEDETDRRHFNLNVYDRPEKFRGNKLERCIVSDEKLRDGWWRRTLRFTIRPGTPGVTVSVDVSDCRGSFHVDAFSVRRVKRTPLPVDGLWYWDASWELDGNLPRRRFYKLLDTHSPFIPRARRFNESLIKAAFVRDDANRLRRAAAYAGKRWDGELDRRCERVYALFDRAHRAYAEIYLAREPRRLVSEVDPLLRSIEGELSRLADETAKRLDALAGGAPKPLAEAVSRPCRIGADGTPSGIIFGSWGKTRFREVAPSLGVWSPQGNYGPSMAEQRADGSLDWSNVIRFHRKLAAEGMPYYAVTTRILTGYLPGAVPPAYSQAKTLKGDPDAFFADRGYWNFWNPQVQKLHVELAASLARQTRAEPNILCYVYAWETGALRHIKVKGENPKKKSETAAFRAFLRKTYGTVEALNKTWRTAHKSFDDIQVPKWEKKYVASPDFYDFSRCRQVCFAELCDKVYRAFKQGAPERAVFAPVGAGLLGHRIDASRIFDSCDIIDGHGSMAAIIYAVSTAKALGKRVALFENNWQFAERDRWGDERACFGGLAKYLNRWLLMDMDLQFWCFPFTSQKAWLWRQAQWSSLVTDYTLLRYAASALPMSIRRARRLEKVLLDTKTASADMLLVWPRTTSLHKPAALPGEIRRITETLRKRGFSFEFRNEDRIASGAEDLSRYKAIILPCAYFLGDGVADKLLEWTRSGGLLVCIGPAGVFDKYGFHDGSLMKRTIGFVPALKEETKYMKVYNWDFGGPDRTAGLVVKPVGRGRAVVTCSSFGEFLDYEPSAQKFFRLLNDACPPPAVASHRDVEIRPLTDSRNRLYLGVLNENPLDALDATITARGIFRKVSDLDLPGGFRVPVETEKGRTSFKIHLAPAGFTIFSLER